MNFAPFRLRPVVIVNRRDLTDLLAQVNCPRCGGEGHEAVIDGRKMRALRLAAGLDLGDVASRMGVSRMTLSRLERSNRTTETQALKFLSAINGG